MWPFTLHPFSRVFWDGYPAQVLDESLSFGVLGDKGLGLCEMAKVSPSKVDAIMGSLELAVAGVGGFCAGRHLTAAGAAGEAGSLDVTDVIGHW